jgi:hypothetical protein
MITSAGNACQASLAGFRQKNGTHRTSKIDEASMGLKALYGLDIWVRSTLDCGSQLPLFFSAASC